MLNFALVQNGVVANIFNCADEENAKSLYPDDTVVDVSDALVQRGWLYADGLFSAPPVTEPTHAELIAQADVTKSYLLSIAVSKISILQDATDPDVMGGNILPGDVALLKLWRQYRVLLNRIDTSTAPEIIWPIQPEV